MKTIPPHIEDFLRDEVISALYRTTGYSWETPVEDLPRKNLCDSVANEFAFTVESEFEYEIESPVRAPVNGAKHFVAVVTEIPKNDTTEPIIVDGTIMQFDEEHPSIVIEYLSSPVVSELYDTIEYEK